MSGTPLRVRPLELDEDLTAALSQDAAAVATELCTAPVVTVRRGRWRPHTELASPSSFGLLLLDGLVLRRVVVDHRHSVEPPGPGDLLRPWTTHVETVNATVEWRAEDALTLVDLDREFLHAARRWPEITIALTDRIFQRQRSLALRLAITQSGRLADSLRLLFWHLAARWGKVGPHGVILPLTLSLQVLADLISAQRRSVSRALAELRRDRLVVKQHNGAWLLLGQAPVAQRLER